MTMNQAPSRVRAVARVGADPEPVGRGPATFLRRRRHGYLGPVSVLQLVLIEALVVALVVLFRHSVVLLVVGCVLAAAILVATFARSGGRWWLERMLLRRQYHRRKGSSHLPADDARLVSLHRLVPDLTIRTVEGPGGTEVGVGRDGAGSFAVVAIVPPAGLNGDPLGDVPLSKLAGLVQDAEQPGAVLQVVRHSVPATGAGPVGQPAADSYRDLAAQYGVGMAADQAIWVAVRFDARTVAEASVGAADDSAELPLMLSVLVRRVSKVLRRAGLEYQVLNADGLIEALTRSCELEQPPPGPQPRTGEGWTGWRSASLMHACFWLSGWPDLRNSGALLDEMSRTPAALTSVALILAPHGDLIELRCLLRVASEPAALDQTCAAARQAVSRTGGSVFRLDGEQAPAVYATAPTGGGAR